MLYGQFSEEDPSCLGGMTGFTNGLSAHETVLGSDIRGLSLVLYDTLHGLMTSPGCSGCCDDRKNYQLIQSKVK